MAAGPNRTPDTAVWYFTAAAFSMALGSVILSGGDPNAWQMKWFTIIGLILLGCGAVVFAKERRQRKHASSDSSDTVVPPTGDSV